MLAHRGFSLLELLVVIVIIAILTTVAVPYYLTAIQNTRNTEAIIWWNSVKRWGTGYNLTEEKARRVENDVNNNGKLKYFTLRVICREKTGTTEPCWEAELHLKDTSQHIQYYLATAHNLQELLCVPLNSAGNAFCQNQSGHEGEPDRTLDDQEAYLIRF